MKASFLFLALICGCSGSVEPPLVVELPPTCRVEAEYIRVQLCQGEPVLVNCTEVSTPNVAPVHCIGPFGNWRAETGNAWCCDDRVEFVSAK